MMPAESARRAQEILRDPGQFQWYVVPLLVLVLYVYAVEVERRNWNLVFAGLALWGVDWFNEIWNGLVFHFTGFAPVWGAPADTAYLILIGLNIEICFMFAILGVVVARTLPTDKNLRILGIPNRWFMAVAASIFCVVVELFLNAAGALTWEYSWWNARAPLLIVIFGYLHFFVISFWVHDMKRLRSKIVTVASIFAFDAAALIIFGPLLGWI